MGVCPMQAEETTLETLVGCVRITALLLWKDWPKDMEAVGLNQQGNFNLRGICPHAACRSKAAFLQVSAPFVEAIPGAQESITGHQISLVFCMMRCQACLRFILAIVTHAANSLEYKYREHYPMGSPDDVVAEEIPDGIRQDFQEALRCLWVDAYNATAEMCRRAVEASCIERGAPRTERFLDDKIDWLKDQQKITPFLAEVAHKIRLGGNRGAHPPEGQLPDAEVEPEPPITKEHAEALVTFAREYFHHVYTVPKQLDKYDFSKPKPIGQPSK